MTTAKFKPESVRDLSIPSTSKNGSRIRPVIVYRRYEMWPHCTKGACLWEKKLYSANLLNSYTIACAGNWLSRLARLLSEIGSTRHSSPADAARESLMQLQAILEGQDLSPWLQQTGYSSIQDIPPWSFQTESENGRKPGEKT